NFTFDKTYDIPLEITKTLTKNEDFLLYDSGMGDEDRVIILGTKSNIFHLSYNKIWLGDDTFKSCPGIFEQLYTIQCKLRGKYLPLLYCFMKRKNIHSYNKLFTFLKEGKKLTGLEHIIFDFEYDSQASFKKVFPNAQQHGCNFHLGQIVWRYVQKSGLSKLYLSNMSFKTNIKMILALSFVPEEKVE
ncbi:hypothetical protein DMUE_2646, partial [Dictyocoela muelleri]